jgi:Tfp pilus assembly protein PilF
VKRDHDAAERHFRQAVRAFPRHASILTKYANFLRTVRGDNVMASEYYKKVGRCMSMCVCMQIEVLSDACSLA